MSKQYNGHKNWNHWNVSLWINNDQGLYSLAHDILVACRYAKAGKQTAATLMLENLREMNITHTHDGAPYSISSIRAAMVGM